MIDTELNGALICWTQAGQGADPLRHNVGYHVGDDPENVTHERQRIATILGTPIVWMDQTHSTRVRVITQQPNGTLTLSDGPVADPTLVHPSAHIGADGLILDARATSEAGVTATRYAVGVMTADCLPVLFADHTGRVVAAVHAGRLGLENGILLHAIERYSQLGIPASAINAIIGPSICAQCYEVPEEMALNAQRTLRDIRSCTSWHTPSLDLPRAARTQLIDAGLPSVTIMGECTYENTLYHSYRRDPRAGRQSSIIAPRAYGGDYSGE